MPDKPAKERTALEIFQAHHREMKRGPKQRAKRNVSTTACRWAAFIAAVLFTFYAVSHFG